MKNGIIALNVLLAIAVAFLLYKQFSLPKKAVIAAPPAKGTASDKNITIGYIEMDSIQNNYELAKTVQAEINKKQSAMSVEIEKLERSFKTKLAGYQKRGATMTEAESEAAKMDLENSQSQIMNKRQSFSEELNGFINSRQMSLRKTIEDFLKEYNANGTYTFIFSYEPGLMYYKDTTYDITSDVLKGLNDRYRNSRK